MKRLQHLITTLALSLMLIACGGDDDDNNNNETANPSVPTTGMFRVMHASSDAPAVDVSIDGMVALAGVDYPQSSTLMTVDSGIYSVEVDGILPTGNATVIGPVNLSVQNQSIHEVVALNSVANIEPLIVSRLAIQDESMVRVTVLHAAHTAPQVDVHVTAPDAEINDGTILGRFSFKESLGPVEIAEGSYRIRVTLPNTTTVVYDSGTLALSAGQDIFAAAVVNPSITDTEGKSPIALNLAIDDAAATLLYSADNGADLRVVHNSSDAPAVDIVVNDGFEAPLVEDLAFPNYTSPYVNVPADTYNVKVAAAGTMTTVIDADLMLENGAVYSVIALNQLNDIEALVLTDWPRRVATEARLRVIHGSTLAGTVDIYVTAVGGDISSVDPAISSFSFKDYTSYISLAAGNYDVTVTGEGSKVPALGPAEISIDANGIYTILARDEVNLSGVGLTLMDDF